MRNLPYVALFVALHHDLGTLGPHQQGGTALEKNVQLADLGERCGNFALQCSDVAGFANQVNQRIAGDNATLKGLRGSVAELGTLQQEASDAAAEIALVAQTANDLLGESHNAVASALAEIGELIDDVVRLGDEVEGFIEAIERVGSISGELDRIARHTSMLAINATIEAAHAGASTSGFAAVAAEVKRLAGSARGATASVTTTVGRLESQARTVIEGMRSGAVRGRTVRSRTSDISRTLSSIAALVVQFGDRAAAIRQSEDVITRHVATLDAGLDGFTSTAAANTTQLGEMHERLDSLEDASNQILDQIAHSGIPTRDTPFILAARRQAVAIGALIEAALAAGALSEAALFDTAYQAIPDSDPPQFMTAFVPFADAQIRPLLDRATAEDAAVVGCCLIDRNGHLPTHISARSREPRPGDRVWNLENARNRQIFMDRQTRRALDSEGDYFLFTYRQDFGEGRYRALRSVFVPMIFSGRRWGLYELGYLI